MSNLIEMPTFNLLIVRSECAEGRPVSPRIIQANDSALKLLGYAEAELTGQPLSMVFSEKSLSCWQAAATNTQHCGIDSSFEAELLSKENGSVSALVSVSSLPGREAGYLDCILLIQALKSGDDLLVMRRVVEQSASAMMITDRLGRIEYINPKFTELTGYEAAELIGHNPNILQSGHMSPTLYKSMWDTLLSSGQWQGEVQNKSKSGRDYWVYESISAIKNQAGEITHFLAVEEDVTHRKAVESALSESEERFRQMAELSGEWLWEQDPNGYYLYSSVAVNQILGFSQQQIIGKHYTELLTDQDRASQTGYSSNQHAFHALVNHYRHQDGHLVLTESTGLPLFDADGKLLKWRGVDRDITARMQFQNALIESEKRNRLIIESSLDAIVIMDAYGIITDWNQRAEKMFGWSVEEAIGRPLAQLIIPQRYHSAHREGMQTFLRTGAGPVLNRQTEQLAARRDGSEFPVELSVSPLKVGNSYIFSGFIHDISGRRAAEQQIRQAEVELAIAQNEIRIAQQIQATLSPSSAIKTDNFAITGLCVPADKVGGDYYDYFFRNETHLDIVIADVSGHSIGPALFMVETRSALRAQHNLSITPAETLGILNKFLFNDLNNADYFITLFYMQVDQIGRQIKYANAGHPPPILLNRLRNDFIELDADGLIVGIRQEVMFEEKSISLVDGDVILFYTDGLIEAESPQQEFFGLERVKRIFLENSHLPPQAIIDALYAALKRFCQKSRFDDDITLMVFKWR
ncbi:MAG: PAS domain S-box protein [Methylomonas sp.]|jgi:PAS domain S-box-containing protein|uniref:PAS domain S-box protein n=1 Tax=Methylomonas sp. TaxID=418 RepID=UPI0025ECC668|nr:PAS domain S-box protein [Methylomonas sp.]MCK9608554.1 PAS domain S-box protein [Methylomonas sp.]